MAVPIRFNESRHLEVEVTLDNIQTTFIIDTGANRTTMDYAFGLSNGIIPELTESTGGGIGNIQMEIYKSIIDLFKVGELEVKHQEMSYLDLSHVLSAFKEKRNITHITGILGAEFLEKHAAIIDYQARYLYIRSSGP